MPNSDEAQERHRWWLLRDAPRADSGVLYHPEAAASEVWVQSIVEVVPFLVSTRDFAPADMQYRMLRSHLWDPESGLYGERYDVDKETWVIATPSATSNVAVAEAMARALREGGDLTPAEMRGRWQRETRELVAACSSLDLDSVSTALLARAVTLGTEDGWLS